jgi:enamine deaminase RidA (YjgF/YER057c/UK114 family)
MGHLELRVVDFEILMDIARSSCCLEWDLFGHESSYYPPSELDMLTDAQRMDVMKRVLHEGYGERILISHDICTQRRARVRTHSRAYRPENAAQGLLRKRSPRDIGGESCQGLHLRVKICRDGRGSSKKIINERDYILPAFGIACRRLLMIDLGLAAGFRQHAGRQRLHHCSIFIKFGPSIRSKIGALMQFINSRTDFPFSDAVIHSGRVLETVLTAVPKGQKTPVAGGPQAEMREIFLRLDEILAQAGVDKTAIVSARLYLQEVNRDIAAVNEVWVEYFGSHPPNRRAYGVDLQAGMLVEAGFVAEIPDSI